MLLHWEQFIVPQLLSSTPTHQKCWQPRKQRMLLGSECCTLLHTWSPRAAGHTPKLWGREHIPFTQVAVATTSTLSLWQSLCTASCFKVKSPVLCEIFVLENALLRFISVQHLSFKEFKWYQQNWYHQKLHFNKSFEFLLSKGSWQGEWEGRGYLSPLILYKDSAQEQWSHFLYCYFSQDLVNITGGIQKSEQAKFPPWCPKCAAPELGGGSAKPARISP